MTAWTQAVRAVSYGSDQPAAADRADTALFEQFAHDDQVAVQAAAERARWGFAPRAGAAAGAATTNRPPMDDPFERLRDGGFPGFDPKDLFPVVPPDPGDGK